MTYKYQPKMPDGSYHHKKKSGKARMPYNRLTYEVKTKRELDHHDLSQRIKKGRRAHYLKNL